MRVQHLLVAAPGALAERDDRLQLFEVLRFEHVDARRDRAEVTRTIMMGTQLRGAERDTGELAVRVDPWHVVNAERMQHPCDKERMRQRRFH